MGNWTSGSEGGFAEMESPVVLASEVPEMEFTIASIDGASCCKFCNGGAPDPALESIRRLLETMFGFLGRRSVDGVVVLSIYL